MTARSEQTRAAKPRHFFRVAESRQAVWRFAAPSVGGREHAGTLRGAWRGQMKARRRRKGAATKARGRRGLLRPPNQHGWPASTPPVCWIRTADDGASKRTWLLRCTIKAAPCTPSWSHRGEHKCGAVRSMRTCGQQAAVFDDACAFSDRRASNRHQSTSRPSCALLTFARRASS